MTRLRDITHEIMASAVALCASAFVCSSAVLGQVDSQQIRDYLQQIRDETGVPGISVAIAVNNEIAFSTGVGYSDLDNGVPATGRTVHNVGSVSKVLALIPVMQLVEQGRVDLDATIQAYLPYFPEKQWPVTLRQILTHTSGIRHYDGEEFGPYDLLEMRHYDDFEEASKLWRDDPLLYEPGSYWYYSSHAVNLLHGVVEAVTGMDFEEYCRRYVWEPAGMLSTAFDVPWRIVQNRGRGYVRDPNGVLINPRYADVSYKYAGGGMISTVEDLARFAIALNDGTLLKPETVNQMYEVQLDPSVERYVRNGEAMPLDHEQALLWWIRTDVQGRDFPSHTGTVKGTRSFLLNSPELGIVVTLQANGLPFDSAKYGMAIAQMFLPPVNQGVN
jgi:CubicO group peptidase (beta-lactamase class C family)